MVELKVNAVVAGTGISATIAVAVLARNGYDVLQVDRNQQYGLHHRTLSIKCLLQMGQSRCLNSRERLRAQYETYVAQSDIKDILEHEDTHNEESDTMAVDEEEGAAPPCILPPQRSKDVRSKKLEEFLNIIVNRHSCDPSVYYELAPFAKVGLEEITALEHLAEENSKYGIDLWPKLLYSQCSMIDLLLSSGAHSYLQFTDTKGAMLYGYEASAHDEKIELHKIPNDKNEISRSKLLSPIEKRKLMVLISSLGDLAFSPKFSSLSLKGNTSDQEAVDEDPFGAFENIDQSWLQYLRDMECTQNIIDLLSYGICLGGSDVAMWTKRNGLERMLKYVKSIGYRGEHDAPFICPLYGTGDIVQAFCRLGAVLGATHMLGTTISSIEFDETSRIEGLTLSNGAKVKTDLLIVEDRTMLPKEANLCQGEASAKDDSPKRYLHVIAIVSPEKVLPDLNIAVIAPRTTAEEETSLQEPIYVFQTGSDTNTAPENMYVIYLLTVNGDSESRIESFADASNPSVKRLLRCFSSLMMHNAKGMEDVLMAVYTAHELAEVENGESVAKHRGWLSGDAMPRNDNGNGIVWISKPMGTPVVPLVEEVPIAVDLCDALLGKPARKFSPFMDTGLEGFLDFKRREEPEEYHEYSAADKLQNIINKYG